MGELEDISRRIGKKLPGLIVTNDPLGLGRDIMDYRLAKFKRHNPEKYNQRRIRIAQEVIELRKDVDNFWKNRRRR